MTGKSGLTLIIEQILQFTASSQAFKAESCKHIPKHNPYILFMEQQFSKLLPRRTLGEVEIATQALLSYNKAVTSYSGCFVASGGVIWILNPAKEGNTALASPLLQCATCTRFHRLESNNWNIALSGRTGVVSES